MDDWVVANLMQPIGQMDTEVLQSWLTTVQSAAEGVFKGFQSVHAVRKLTLYLSEAQKNSMDNYLQFRTALEEAVTMASAKPADKADVRRSIRVLGDIKKSLAAAGTVFNQQWGFMMPETCWAVLDAKVGSIVKESYVESCTNLCKMAYGTHFDNPDNTALAQQHNTALAKACVTTSRAACVCLSDAETAGAEENIEFLKNLCICDITRRVLHQHAPKITAAKPAPINESPVNVSLGRFNKAMSNVEDVKKQRAALKWCLNVLNVEDKLAVEHRVMNMFAEWTRLGADLSARLRWLSKANTAERKRRAPAMQSQTTHKTQNAAPRRLAKVPSAATVCWQRP